MTARSMQILRIDNYVMNDKLLEIVAIYRNKIDDNSIFFLPDIPEKKLKNAIDKYAPSVKKEDVLLLIDDTVFGKATEGVIITSSLIYANQAFEDIKRIDFCHIKSAAIVEGVMGCALYINDNKIIATTQPSKSAMRLITELIREISEISRGDAKKTDNSSNIQDALIKLKSIFEMGLISKEEYDEKRKEYIAKL